MANGGVYDGSGPRGGKTASRKKITEDSVFWLPGRMGNRRGKMLPNYTKRLGQS
jgi:hypothetical protein